MLKDIFRQLTIKYPSGIQIIEKLWAEIEKQHSRYARYYHNLSHLENMLSELMQVHAKINDWDTVLFALFYHDIIYKPTSDNNEERSAELATARLHEINFPKEQIKKCKAMILATKTHLQSPDGDTNYFIDADLSILGQSWENYSAYANNVRKEYSIYPDLIYKPGRRKAVRHFLKMDRIFKTDFFFDKFEEKARENLSRELNML
jgi:predicted metal-dependent HD superfamily phosphohydrolase